MHRERQGARRSSPLVDTLQVALVRVWHICGTKVCRTSADFWHGQSTTLASYAYVAVFFVPSVTRPSAGSGDDADRIRDADHQFDSTMFPMAPSNQVLIFTEDKELDIDAMLGVSSFVHMFIAMSFSKSSLTHALKKMRSAELSPLSHPGRRVALRVLPPQPSW